jgi:hypothetical protein
MLTTLGIGLFLYKLLELNFPLLPETEAKVWNVEARLTFVARNRPVKVSLYIPCTSRHHVVMDENFISRGYGLTTSSEGLHGNRQAVWAIRKVTGLQTLYYRSVVRDVYTKKRSSPLKSPPEVESPHLDGPHFEAAESIIADIRARSADVGSLVAALMKRLNQFPRDDNVTLLLGKQATESKKIEVAVLLLAQAAIPARVVHGIRLEEQTRDAPLLEWLEVYEENAWHAYDPVTGNAGIPDDYLAWWRGPGPLAQLTGGTKLNMRLAVSVNQEAAMRAAVEHGKIVNPLLIRFSLFSLPLQTQAVYRVLLLVPLGAFILVVLRNIIGIKTFGTFMPVLIALAFRETRLLWGILLFSLLVGLGLGVRFYLERLKLLLVPRLASVLIVVVLLMAALSIVTHKLGLERGLSIALFPMVILTMTIERMTVVWEERGASEALQQGVGSLVGAALTYLIMTISYVRHIVFVFPEVLFVLLAGTLLLGRYTGYRLLELGRFKALRKEK